MVDHLLVWKRSSHVGLKPLDITTKLDTCSLNKSLTSGKPLAIASKSVEIVQIIIKKIIFMNIHTQARLLVKYELVTLKNKKVRAFHKSVVVPAKKSNEIV